MLTEAFNHRYFALALMLLNSWDYNMIFYLLCYRGIFTFFASHDGVKKTFIFSRWRSCSQVKKCCSTFLGFKLYITQCLCFWIIPNDFQCFKTVGWLTSNDSASLVCTWHESSQSNTSNSSSLNFFGESERYLSSTSKSLFFKYLNRYLNVVSNRAWSA